MATLNLTPSELNTIRQEFVGLSSEDWAAVAAYFQEIINSGKCLSLLCPNFADAILTDIINPEISKRGLTQVDIDVYKQEAKDGVAMGVLRQNTGEAKLQYLNSLNEYLGLRNDRLAKNRKAMVWGIIIVAVLVIGYFLYRHFNKA